MTGFAIGVTRFILEFAVYPQPPACESDEKNAIPDVISKVHYLHFGCLLFAISFIVIIVISLLTKPINPAKVGQISSVHYIDWKMTDSDHYFKAIFLFLMQLLRMTYMSRNEPGTRLEQDADDNLPEHLEMYNEARSTEEAATSTTKLAEAEEDESK